MNSQKNRFEKNPTLTITFFVLFFILLSVFGIDFCLKKFFGLGNPILYDNNPIYGFRPLPSQKSERFFGSKIEINNLGLRSVKDWDQNKDGKILFLGDSVTYGGSYISNSELFSNLVVDSRSDLLRGNAGVNTWGVENIHGLIVEEEFLPAEYYITCLIEDDFYRGLVRLQGLPYYNTKPSSALMELFQYFTYSQNNLRYLPWQQISSEEQRMKVINKAVSKLSIIDSFIKSKGFKHRIFILPTRSQLIFNHAKDRRVEEVIGKYKMDVFYLFNELKDVKDPESIFLDEVHLTKYGHKIYADVISKELEGFLKRPASP